MLKESLILFSILIITISPVFADSDRSAKVEFAGTLEETLGHFWALELNLDEKNSKLAFQLKGRTNTFIFQERCIPK